MSIQRRIYEQNLGVNEAVKVGDTVHIGHGTKGGTGVTGKVTKVSGGMVHIQNDKGDTFKGPVDRVTVKEAVNTAQQVKNIIGQETDHANRPGGDPKKRAAQRATQIGMRLKKARIESVEMEESSAGTRTTPGTAGQNPLITAFGGDKEMRNAPSYKRYQARLKAEREERARKAAAADKPTDKAPEPKKKELPKNMRSEAIKYDSAGDSTGTVTGKGKRDRGPGGEVMVKYKGSETYPQGAKLPIGARDVGRLLKQARKSGTTPYDSRNLRNPRLTKDHVELEGLDLSEMNFLGKDKKFGREFYEKDGQLHVKKSGGTYVQNLGSVDVPANKKMMKGLVKDSNESFDKLTKKQARDADHQLNPTRATVARVRLRATDDQVAGKVKKWQSEKGGNPGNTKNRRKRDLELRDRLRDHVELDEVSPPGFEGTVKAMKKRHSDKIDNPWALAWWMKNKGYKSHKKPDGSPKEGQ